MKSLYLQDILNIIDGHFFIGNGNPIIKYIAARPKMLKNHTLFFDIRKKYTQLDLFQKYKSPIIVTEDPDKFKHLGNYAIIIKVTNINKSYWAFINYYRSLFQIPIIGLTGTCGKTTTKEMIKHILSKHYNVHATYKSHNASKLNLHYLIGIDDKTEVAVFEMGVDEPGDLLDSCKYFQPKIRLLLNIGVHHLKGCKTPEAYFKAKEEILEGLDSVNGTLILNVDDKNIKKIDVSNFQRIVTFGFDNMADYKASNVSYADGGMAFTLHYQKQDFQVYVPGFGKHNVYNALAAIAATGQVSIETAQAVNSLATFKPVKEHLEIRSGTKGCIVIEDTWNNSPPSMAAALEVLKDISNSKTRIALLGYMPQLGKSNYAIDQYAQLGEKVVETGVDLLVVVEEEAEEIGRKALELGMDKNKVYFCNEGSEIYKIIEPFINKDTIILLKITHRQMVEPSFVELKNLIIL